MNMEIRTTVPITAASSLNVSNLTFTDFEIIGERENTVLEFNVDSENGMINVSNISFISGSLMYDMTLMAFSNPYGITSATGLTMKWITTRDECMFFKVLKSKVTTINDLHFEGLTSLEEGDWTNIALNLMELQSPTDNEITFNNVTYRNGTVLFLHISNQLQSTSVDQHITFNRINYGEIYTWRREGMIKTHNLRSLGVFKIIFNEFWASRVFFGLSEEVKAEHVARTGLELHETPYFDVPSDPAVY